MIPLRIVVNPAAGGGRGEALLARLRELGPALGAEVAASSSAEDLVRQARRAVREGVARLAVAGGDGTVHHAVQALAGSGCDLALLPVGRGNDYAASLGVPSEFEAALELARTGVARLVDLGRCGEGRFAFYCSVGFDGEVTRFANRKRRLLRGSLVYVQGVLWRLPLFDPPRVRVEHDGGVFEGRVMFVVAANGPLFGGGMRIAPEADLSDGLLDLVLVRRVSRLELLRVFPKVFSGGHVGHPAVSILRTRRLRIRCERPMSLFADGEEFQPLPAEGAEIGLEPGALRVVGG